MRKKIVLSLLAFCVVLGSFSVHPFTKLLIPWTIARQWYRVNYPNQNDQLCIDEIRRNGAQFALVTVPPEHIERGCNGETPLQLSGLPLALANIGLPSKSSQVYLSCKFTRQLQKFTEQTINPQAIHFFGSKPKTLLHKGGYACRDQGSWTGLKSEHAFGDALDFAGIELEDGRIFTIEADYSRDSPAGEYLRSLAHVSCKHFGTVLGPHFDELHDDHLHWAIGFPRRCVY